MNERNKPGDSPADSADLTSEAVGVGPWPTNQPLPVGPQYDPELLRNGDARNVPDHYRYWKLAAISEDLDRLLQSGPGEPTLEIAIENIGHDFNIGSMIRTANGLGVRHVHIVGRRRFNRRGAMVTDRYLHLHYHPEVRDLAAYAAQQELPIVGMDNFPGAEPLETVALPPRTLMVFGEESQGLTPDMQNVLERLVQITQYGSTRSLNVGHAAAISIWAWRRTYPPRPASLANS